MKKNDLKPGDMVLWSGNFGTAPAERAVVRAIEQTDGRRDGFEVPSVAWSALVGRSHVISLTSGHWCYGSQLKGSVVFITSQEVSK